LGVAGVVAAQGFVVVLLSVEVGFAVAPVSAAVGIAVESRSVGEQVAWALCPALV
jgi:hypothetical protein